MTMEACPEGHEDHAFEAWRDEQRGPRPGREPGWACWTLTRDDIDMAAEKLGITPDKLSDDAYQDIALCFAKGFEAGLPDWEPILECAVEAVMGESG